MALSHGVKKFIFASSIEAMGPVTKSDIPASEEYPCLPVSNYGRSKLAAERLVSGYTQGAKNLRYYFAFGQCVWAGESGISLADA